MPHRIGIVGLGIMGQRMLAAMGGHPRFAVTAAWDPSPEAASMLRRECPRIALAPSAEGLARRDDLDAIYIASPPASHAAHVNLAWDCGKAAFCEKPLAVELASARQLVERAAVENRRAAVNFPFATSLPAAAMMREAAAGVLGAIESIAISIDFAAWPRSWQRAGRWLSERAEGGFTREVVSHFLFLAQRLVGPLSLVSAHAVFPEGGVAAETAIEARLTAGAVPVTLRGGVGATDADDRNSLTLTGVRGALRLADWVTLARRDGEVWREVDFGPGPSIRQRSFTAQLDALAAMIEGRPHPLATLAEGLAVQRLVEAILKSG